MRVDHSAFRSVGRLCNQLSSYANLLVYQRLFNVQPYLPSEHVKERIQTFFENVTMPVLIDNTSVPACRVTVRGWGGQTLVSGVLMLGIFSVVQSSKIPHIFL